MPREWHGHVHTYSGVYLNNTDDEVLEHQVEQYLKQVAEKDTWAFVANVMLVRPHKSGLAYVEELVTYAHSYCTTKLRATPFVCSARDLTYEFLYLLKDGDIALNQLLCLEKHLEDEEDIDEAWRKYSLAYPRAGLKQEAIASFKSVTTSRWITATNTTNKKR